MSIKNPLTPAGIEPATFRFVAQHLNHCATAVPNSEGTAVKKKNRTCAELGKRVWQGLVCNTWDSVIVDPKYI